MMLKQDYANKLAERIWCHVDVDYKNDDGIYYVHFRRTCNGASLLRKLAEIIREHGIAKNDLVADD